MEVLLLKSLLLMKLVGLMLTLMLQGKLMIRLGFARLSLCRQRSRNNHLLCHLRPPRWPSETLAAPDLDLSSPLLELIGTPSC